MVYIIKGSDNAESDIDRASKVLINYFAGRKVFDGAVYVDSQQKFPLFTNKDKSGEIVEFYANTNHIVIYLNDAIDFRIVQDKLFKAFYKNIKTHNLNFDIILPVQTMSSDHCVMINKINISNVLQSYFDIMYIGQFTDILINNITSLYIDENNNYDAPEGFYTDINITLFKNYRNIEHIKIENTTNHSLEYVDLQNLYTEIFRYLYDNNQKKFTYYNEPKFIKNVSKDLAIKLLSKRLAGLFYCNYCANVIIIYGYYKINKDNILNISCNECKRKLGKNSDSYKFIANSSNVLVPQDKLLNDIHANALIKIELLTIGNKAYVVINDIYVLRTSASHCNDHSTYIITSSLKIPKYKLITD